MREKIGIEEDVFSDGIYGDVSLVGRNRHVRIKFEEFMEVKDDFDKFSDYFDDVYGYKDDDVYPAYLEECYGGNGYGPLTEKLFNRLGDRGKFRFLCNPAISSNIKNMDGLQMYIDEQEGVYLTSWGKKPEPPRRVFTHVCMTLYVSDYLFEHQKSVPFVLYWFQRKHSGLTENERGY